MAHRFTDEQLSLMKEKYPGDSAIVIAEELGVSPQTVRRRLRAMGVPIKASGRRADSRQTRRNKNRDRWLKRRYGISQAQFQMMTEAQRNRCAACGCSDSELCIDHDHSTGFVRALLCKKCNSALGYVDESPERCEALAQYIRDWKALHGS